MLGGLQGHTDADRVTELPAPDSGCKHDSLGLDHPQVGDDPRHTVVVRRDPGDGHTLEDGRPTLARSLCQGHGHVVRVRPPFDRHIEAPQKIRRLRHRPEVGDLRRTDLVRLLTESSGVGGFPLHRLDARRGGGDVQMATPPEAGRQTGLVLQTRVQLARVDAHRQGGFIGHAGGRDQAGRVPCGPRSQLMALQNQHVGPSLLRQVVGRRQPDNSASDDHDLRPLGNGVRHRSALSCLAGPGDPLSGCSVTGGSWCHGRPSPAGSG